MATGTASPVAVLRDADLRSAPQDEADGWHRYDSNFGNALLAVILHWAARGIPVPSPRMFATSYLRPAWSTDSLTRLNQSATTCDQPGSASNQPVPRRSRPTTPTAERQGDYNAQAHLSRRRNPFARRRRYRNHDRDDGLS